MLVEGFSKRSDIQLSGRADNMKRVIFDDILVPSDYTASLPDQLVKLKPGDYVACKVHACSTGTLFAQPLGRTTLQAFAAAHPAADPSLALGLRAPAQQKEAAVMAC